VRGAVRLLLRGGEDVAAGWRACCAGGGCTLRGGGCTLRGAARLLLRWRALMPSSPLRDAGHARLLRGAVRCAGR